MQSFNGIKCSLYLTSLKDRPLVVLDVFALSFTKVPYFCEPFNYVHVISHIL